MTEQRVTSVGALARLNAGEQLRATQAGVLIRIEQTVLRATTVGALVRMSPLVVQMTMIGVLVRGTPVTSVAAPVYVFGLREVKLVRDGVIVTLDAAQSLAIRERVKSGQISGNDHTLAVATLGDVLEWELEAGGVPLAAYGLMTGRSVAIDGDEPERTATLLGQALEDFPFFRIYGKSLGDETDDLHVKIFYAKLTGEPQGLFGEGQFWTTQCDGVALAGPEGLYEMVHNVTAQELDLPT
jgi:hypothetical protein